MTFENTSCSQTSSGSNCSTGLPKYPMPPECKYTCNVSADRIKLLYWPTPYDEAPNINGSWTFMVVVGGNTLCIIAPTHIENITNTVVQHISIFLSRLYWYNWASRRCRLRTLFQRVDHCISAGRSYHCSVQQWLVTEDRTSTFHPGEVWMIQNRQLKHILQFLNCF